ncbi:hypothetical protein [Actinacidiphila alni]|nr:hypothetical protein [Actinacidiphila alni]
MTSTEAQPVDVRQLVPYVASVMGEGVASVASAAVAVAVLLLIPVNATDGGMSTPVQFALLGGAGLFWGIGLLAGRAGVARAQESAVPVPGPQGGLSDDQRKALFRGRIRNALFAVVMLAVCGAGFHCLWLGLMVPLIQTLTMVAVLRMAAWERRHGVVLWKPSLAAVGREAHRAAPFYTTPRSG